MCAGIFYFNRNRGTFHLILHLVGFLGPCHIQYQYCRGFSYGQHHLYRSHQCAWLYLKCYYDASCIYSAFSDLNPQLKHL